MAKRTKYSGRPTGHPSAARSTSGGDVGKSRTTIASSSSAAGSLTNAEVERATELESALVAREREANADNARRRARTGRIDMAVAADASTPLSVRAAHEYAYVARDVRRIGITATVMFAILAILWLVVHVGGVTLF